MKPSNQPSAGPLDAPDLASLCQKIRRAADAVRVSAVSLHDAAGETLWLTESSMGPDEHNAVCEAAEGFRNPQATPIIAHDLGDSRSAVLIRLAGSRQVTLGIVMLIVDSRAIGPAARGLSKLMTPAMQSALEEFTGIRIATLAKTTPVPPPARQQVTTPVSPQLDRLNAALRANPIALHAQKLVPLARGGNVQRYEVLLRNGASTDRNAAPEAMLKSAVDSGLGSMIDRRVLTELIGWLIRHPGIWQDGHSRFTMNLTATALFDEHFLKFVELCVGKASLPQGLIGFEASVPTLGKAGARMPHIAATLQRIGCPLVLDDFDLRTECFSLLRLPGVNLLKLSHTVTAQLRSDRIAQATVTAVAQMSRVLGIHTVAKRTESAAEHEWLTALGVDFVQSSAFSPPVPIETLASGHPRQEGISAS